MSATLKKAFDKEVTEQVAKQVKEQVKIHSDKENARLIQIFEKQFKEQSKNENTRLIQIFEEQFEEHSAKQKKKYETQFEEHSAKEKKKYETQYAKLKDEVKKETRLKTQFEEKVAEKVAEIKKLTNAKNELTITKDAIKLDLKECIKGKGKCEPCEPCESSPMQTSPTHSASRKNSKSQSKPKSPQSKPKSPQSKTKSPQSKTKSPQSKTKSPQSKTKSPINCYDSYKNNFKIYKDFLLESIKTDKNLLSGKRFVMMNNEKIYLNVKNFEEYAFHKDAKTEAPFYSVDAFINNFYDYEQAKQNMMWFHRFNNYEKNARLKKLPLFIHTDRYTTSCMHPDRVVDKTEQAFIDIITEINKNISGLDLEYFKREGDETNIYSN